MRKWKNFLKNICVPAAVHMFVGCKFVVSKLVVGHTWHWWQMKVLQPGDQDMSLMGRNTVMQQLLAARTKHCPPTQ